jgi:lysophospholipase L1-like esterase
MAVRPSPPVPARASRMSIGAGLVLALAGIVVSLALVEAALRLSGFEFHLMPTVQFGWPDPRTIATNYADDPDLFWVTRDYSEKLRAARRTHPDVIFMGDSCTEFGTYPARTMDALAADGAPVRTGMHLAAGGWSSEQGLVQLQRDIIPLHPKVIVIFYGWNDHWMALGPTDPDLHLARRFLWVADHSRIAQAALKARVGLSARGDHRPSRVPPDRYRANLDRMASLAKDAGITPVFVTAPSNYVAGHEPEYLLRRHVQRLSDVIPLHQQYVQLTRDAARDSAAVLCDAASAFAALPPPHDRYFKSDAIHFTPEGDRQLAQVVSGCILHTLGHSEGLE